MSGGHGGHVDPHNKENQSKTIRRTTLRTAAQQTALLAGGLGVLAVAFCAIGFWFPTAVHLF